MSFFTSGEGYARHHLIDGYDWSIVGGSREDAAFAIARQYPDIHLIMQELDEVVATSKEEPGLNVKFIVHDFFKSSLSKVPMCICFAGYCTIGQISTAY